MGKIKSVAITTNNMKGKKIKLSSKKKTNEAREQCTHHYYSKGHMKTRLKSLGDGTGICKISGTRLRFIPYEKDEIEDLMDNTRSLCNHTVFISAELGMKAQTDFIASFKTNLTNIEKICKKVEKAGRKVDSIKKKKNRMSGGGNAQLGSFVTGSGRR